MLSVCPTIFLSRGRKDQCRHSVSLHYPPQPKQCVNRSPCVKYDGKREVLHPFCLEAKRRHHNRVSSNVSTRGRGVYELVLRCRSSPTPFWAADIRGLLPITKMKTIVETIGNRYLCQVSWILPSIQTYGLLYLKLYNNKIHETWKGIVLIFATTVDYNGDCLTLLLKLKFRFKLLSQSEEWSTRLIVGTGWALICICTLSPLCKLRRCLPSKATDAADLASSGT